METLRHLLPSLGSLVVFEAAGRLASFSAAGRELGMSQAAVSPVPPPLEDVLRHLVPQLNRGIGFFRYLSEKARRGINFED